MTRAAEGWLKCRETMGSVVRLRVAFHQASKTTSSRGHCRPVEVTFRELSAVKNENRRPSPRWRSQLSVTAKAVPKSETMETFRCSQVEKAGVLHQEAQVADGVVFPEPGGAQNHDILYLGMLPKHPTHGLGHVVVILLGHGDQDVAEGILPLSRQGIHVAHHGQGRAGRLCARAICSSAPSQHTTPSALSSRYRGYGSEGNSPLQE